MFYHYTKAVLFMTLRIITPLTKWGSVWGTSVTVSVTISTSYYYYSFFPFFVRECSQKLLEGST